MSFFLILVFSQLTSALEVGQRYLSQKEYEKAYQAFSQVYFLSKGTPEGEWAQYYMSLAQIGMGDTLQALATLLSLRDKTLDDSLGTSICQTLISLAKNREDSLKYIKELVFSFPINPRRRDLIQSIVNKVDTAQEVELRKILASDYETKKDEIQLGFSLLHENPGYALIIANRHNSNLLRLKALFRTKKYADFYYEQYKHNPEKVLTEEHLEFLRLTNYSPYLIGQFFLLNPESEMVAFEFARILEAQNLPPSRFTKTLKDTICKAYFSWKKLTENDIRYLETLPESNLRNFILAKVCLYLKHYAKSLLYALTLPDSLPYNELKIEIADSLLSNNFITWELKELLESIKNYTPLTRRDERLFDVYFALNLETDSIVKVLEWNDSKFESQIPSLRSNIQEDTLLLEKLYNARKWSEILKISENKPLPASMKRFVASALYYKGMYEEALNLLESDPEITPKIYLKALLKVDDPSPYLSKLPKNLKEEEAYYLYQLAIKIGKPDILSSYNAPAFNFYRAILNNNPDSAMKYYNPKDKFMQYEYSAFLLNHQDFDKVIEITKDINPLYPLELKTFENRATALFESAKLQELLSEIEDPRFSIISSDKVFLLASLSALKLGDLDRALIYALRVTSTEGKFVLNKVLLVKGYTEMVDTAFISDEDKILYFYKTNSVRKLQAVKPNSQEEAEEMLKYITLLQGEVPESLYNQLASQFSLTEDFKSTLKNYALLAKGKTDSLLKNWIEGMGMDAELAYYLSQFLIEKGDLDKAKELLLSWVDTAPCSLKHYIYFRLGNMEATRGNYSNSIFYYSKALECGKTYEKEIFYNMAIAFKNTQDLDSAFLYLERLYEDYKYDEISIESAINLGYLLVENQKDPEKAVSILKDVIGVGKKEQDCEALYWLAKAYITLSDLRSAITTLKRLYTYYGEFPDWRDTAKLDAAKIFVYMNYREKAKNLYQDIIKSRKSDDPVALEAKQEMEFFKLQ